MKKKDNFQEIDWSILLHDIRSVQNVASIFRLAEVFGVEKIYLSGITPGPLDRFSRPREDFLKISLGAEKSVEWERIGEEILGVGELRRENGEAIFAPYKNLENFLRNFKTEDGIVLALEQSENSIDYRTFSLVKNKKYLLVPGREREGLDKNILKMCDQVLEIPQYGNKESLNIFSSVSIAVARLFG